MQTTSVLHTTYVEGEIIKITKTDSSLPSFRYEVMITEGQKKNKKVHIDMLSSSTANNLSFKEHDRVFVSFTTDASGKVTILIADYVRKQPLLILFGLFFVFVITIGRKKGLLSFIGMCFSFVIIGNFIVPAIVDGNNPILISLLGAALIIPVTFYMAHGINKKTTISVISTFGALVVTGLLAYVFVELTRLTGYAAEEATYLSFIKNGTINIRNLLLAGIIIGAMGVLDDITISQTSAIEQLSIANPRLTKWQLYSHAMAIGRDHIASLVNTLVLVYAGAALPLFLLAYDAKISIGYVINQEIIATEIVRTLVSSIGIISAVPLSTFLGILYLKKK